MKTKNKIKTKIVISLTMVFLASVFAGCANTKQAIPLAEKDLEFAKILAQKQDESLECFSKFTQDVEAPCNELLSAINKGKDVVKDLSDEAIKARSEAIKKDALSKFDSKAWVLLNEDFEKELESVYWVSLHKYINEKDDDWKKLQQEADAHPTDINAFALASNMRRAVQYDCRLALEKEVELRKKVIERLIGARKKLESDINQETPSSLGGEISEEKPITKILNESNVENAANDNKTKNAISFEAVRKDIESYRASMKEFHAVHQAGLEAVLKTLSQKNILLLMLTGAGQGIKAALPTSFGSLSNVVDTQLVKGVDKAESLLGKFSTKVTDLVNKKIDDVKSETLRDVSSAAATGVKVTPNQ